MKTQNGSVQHQAASPGFMWRTIKSLHVGQKCVVLHIPRRLKMIMMMMVIQPHVITNHILINKASKNQFKLLM